MNLTNQVTLIVLSAISLRQNVFGKYSTVCKYGEHIRAILFGTQLTRLKNTCHIASNFKILRPATYNIAQSLNTGNLRFATAIILAQIAEIFGELRNRFFSDIIKCPQELNMLIKTPVRISNFFFIKHHFEVVSVI
ncbi:hypothetical protein WJ05_27290 [Burkholderia vietnamiensis]|nr:hypothetical protein WJ05_27290 [Burkholderia vietnamiensis]